MDPITFVDAVNFLEDKLYCRESSRYSTLENTVIFNPVNDYFDIIKIN